VSKTEASVGATTWSDRPGVDSVILVRAAGRSRSRARVTTELFGDDDRERATPAWRHVVRLTDVAEQSDVEDVLMIAALTG